MNKRKIFGWIILAIGFFVFFASPISSLTGLVIAENITSSLGVWVYALGLVMMIVGSLMISQTDLEGKVESGEVSGASPAVEERLKLIRDLIKEQRRLYRTNFRYLQGLNKLEDLSRGFAELAEESKDNKGLRENQLHKMDRIIMALRNRPAYMAELPTHNIDFTRDKASTVGKLKDLPDWGLYDYKPLSLEKKPFLKGKTGRRSSFIDLTLVHYTDDEPYKSIKKALESARRGQSSGDARFYTDENGYSFFVETAVKEGLNISELRNLLGTTFQRKLGKGGARNPQRYISFKVRVPMEKVLTKYEHGIRKYAIAGGISFGDIIPGSVYGGRYRSKHLPEQRVENWFV
jgi:hypothetical protein